MDYRDWLVSFGPEDYREAAVEALNDLGRLSRRARGLLLPILTEAILMERRKQASSVERSVSIGRVLAGETTLEQRAERLASTFALGDGRRVSWGKATAEDHRMRIEYLSAHIRGVLETISLHEDAIAAIEAAGVSCLDEIEEAA